MENAPQQPAVQTNKREPSLDPVKAQGILASLTQKERNASKFWSERWGFYLQQPQIREEDARKIGMSREKYREAVESLNCQPDPKSYPVSVKPSPTPLPKTSSAIIGRRSQCSLEFFGRLVTTSRDIPTRPPLKRGQVYDPYKQTIVFLGSIEGDPISYKLPPSRCDVTPEMLCKPVYPKVAALCQESVEKAMRNSTTEH